MRLLALVSEAPWPPHSGYRIRAWEILTRLAERFETRLICLDRGDVRRDRSWESRFARVRHVSGGRVGPVLMARSLFTGAPHHALAHDGAELRRAIAEEAEGCDAVVAHYLYFARALSALGPSRPRLILDQHNLDRDTWESHAQAASGLARWWLMRQAELVRRDERRYLPMFDVIFSVSEPDAARTRAIAGPDVRVEVAGNGADCERLQPALVDREGTTVLFTGTRARRNVDGLSWFIRECWPRVRAAIPRATLLVAGDMSPNDLPDGLGHETGVTFTGALDDLAPALSAADVAIVPIRLGGGTKLKTFEALASGVPVVALSASATGSCCGEANGVLAEGDSPAYAAAVIRLLRDAPLRLRLGVAGRRHAERAHDWCRIAARVGDVVAEVSGASPGLPNGQGTEQRGSA